VRARVEVRICLGKGPARHRRGGSFMRTFNLVSPGTKGYSQRMYVHNPNTILLTALLQRPRETYIIVLQRMLDAIHVAVLVPGIRP
jgi:hypothetical protein